MFLASFARLEEIIQICRSISARNVKMFHEVNRTSDKIVQDISGTIFAHLQLKSRQKLTNGTQSKANIDVLLQANDLGGLA